MIAIIDYGMGNLKSLANALEYIGMDCIITSDSDVICDSDRIILPGVGAFGDAIHNLNEKGLDKILAQQVLKLKKPFLGICLGLQLLAKSSTEHGFNDGLGWFDAQIIRFKPQSSIKIPHMGWNDIQIEKNHPLFYHLKSDELTFYFVHSFHITCDNKNDVVATCTYGDTFPAVIAKENIIATQFHPEKSQDNGLQILKNFMNWSV